MTRVYSQQLTLLLFLLSRKFDFVVPDVFSEGVCLSVDTIFVDHEFLVVYRFSMLDGIRQIK
jgi:hypothetical protein